jgi:hypothetical protein
LKNKEKYKNCVGALGREKAVALKRGGWVKTECLQKTILWASYHVAHLLAKESKPPFDGAFVRRCLQHILQEICPEKKKTVFNTTSLSHTTMMRQVDISNDLLNQL